MIGRREFITVLGGAATAWPVAARAQQGKKLRVASSQSVRSADQIVDVLRSRK